MSNLDMEIEAYGYATDLINVLDLNENDKVAWNMKSEGMSRFVDGLTALAALEIDERGIFIRRILLAQGAKSIQTIVDALTCREMLLKCKSANAIGSICMCQSAGEDLMEKHGSKILGGILRMLQTKNRWAQGDACFVLGWIARWSNDVILNEIANHIPTVCNILKSTFHVVPKDELDHDRESNLRIYPLVLLLNLCQRKDDLDMSELLDAMNMLILALADDHARMNEAATIAQLTISIIGRALTMDAKGCCAFILNRKLLPPLVRLTRLPFDSQVLDQVRAILDIVIEYR